MGGGGVYKSPKKYRASPWDKKNISGKTVMMEKNIEQASELPHPHSCHVKKLGKEGNRTIMKRDTRTHTHTQY